MDHYMEPPSSQAIDEDNQEAVINANIAELESQHEDYNEILTATPVKANDNIPQPSAPKKQRKNMTSTGTRGKQPASKRKLQFTDDDVEEEDEQQQPSSLGKNTLQNFTVFQNFHIHLQQTNNNNNNS